MSRLTAGLAALLLAVPAARAADAPFPQTAFINEQIAAKWAEAEIKKPAARCSDNEFLRRAFIDLIGRSATPEEVIDFDQDSSKDKRARLINRLFQGLQTQCTQCHDHPFNKEWVQADFWGVNAFFRQTNMKGTPTRPVQTGQMMPNIAVVELYDDPALNPTGRVFYERRDGK